ncbi:hypothetical protein BCR36DRAFT_399767 [Piromyces finnis]|uniref:EGF-like domain-containing protein n=1 Tax=Piromyces finnis TaxID=1754191 RepID=A0A1Y1V0J6_9FUNG|nr:hypothetical protein BCR36DRAFT_399767 [Piromyces finnis]|eukprot:ORX43920.1 hypothetical protein BCR36DRAFT_399767 [Piromyces finnis]
MNNSTIDSTFYAQSGYDYVNIKNTVFEDINIKSTFPLIEGINLKLEYILNKTSNIFHGNYCGYTISNTTFKNITLKNSIPAISDSAFSYFIITNTEFRDLSLLGSLFYEDSSYKLTNIKLSNINTNSNALLNFIYKDVFINNLESENISCYGDDGDSSFLSFDSGEEKRKLTINNLNAKNMKLNGSLIKIKGQSSEVIIENSVITNITSYGSLINYSSIKNKVILSNLEFTNNINNNKLDCGGIKLSHDINLKISDSIFNDNYSKSDGGVLCISNITNIELDLTSNTFIKNSAINGGAIYIGERYLNNKDAMNSVTIKGNQFLKNSAENFGGAIYSDYDLLHFLDISESEVTLNKAGIMGGGMFISNISQNETNSIKNMAFTNNTVNSYINDYSSKPSYIKLNSTITNKNITSGKHLPLTFVLYDEFDNIIEDITKYYSSITLRVVLEEENSTMDDYARNIKLDYNLIGNIGSFSKGICELNKFVIYATPNNYKLKVIIDNYNEDIQLKFDDIEIVVNDCWDNQIKMYDSKDILYCVDPICRDDCPVPNAAVCIAGYNEKINNIESNICQCLPGLKGDHCNIKIFVDYSNLFSTYSDYLGCSLNFILRHTGIVLFLLIFYIINTINYELGNPYIIENNKGYLYTSSSLDDISIFNTEEATKSKNRENKKHKNIDKDSEYYLPMNIKGYLKKVKGKGSNEAISIKNEKEIKKIKRINSLFFEMIFVYTSLIVFICIITTLIYKTTYNVNMKDNLNIVQGSNGHWFYKCELENYDLFINLAEIIIMGVILIEGSKLNYYENIFKCTRYVTASIIICILLGPLINVISYSLLQNQRYLRVFFDTLTNIICYFLVFIIFSWDKIYYVFKKEANDPSKYFILKVHIPCRKHNSTCCGCGLSIQRQEFLQLIRKSIDFYRIYSSFFEIIDRKLIFVNVGSKISLLDQKVENF